MRRAGLKRCFAVGSIMRGIGDILWACSGCLIEPSSEFVKALVGLLAVDSAWTVGDVHEKEGDWLLSRIFPPVRGFAWLGDDIALSVGAVSVTPVLVKLTLQDIHESWARAVGMGTDDAIRLDR